MIIILLVSVIIPHSDTTNFKEIESEQPAACLDKSNHLNIILSQCYFLVRIKCIILQKTFVVTNVQKWNATVVMKHYLLRTMTLIIAASQRMNTVKKTVALSDVK